MLKRPAAILREEEEQGDGDGTLAPPNSVCFPVSGGSNVRLLGDPAAGGSNVRLLADPAAGGSVCF